jgi:signal transduction histidine kinase
LVKTDLKDKIKPDMMEYFIFIESAGNRLIRTVDLVLNASEMQLGTYEPTFAEFGLVKEIISKLSGEYKKLVEDKGLEFHYSSNISEVIIRGDSYSIYQIFVNLIENAIKYTKEGCITLAIESDANCITKVSVEDTGIGMSEEFLNNLFEPFMQEERGYSRRFEGNGLGLSLVKKYCDMNGISITAESQKDRGSKFIVTFNQIK